ncbi:MAG: chemotaxis protein CheX [Deltaproteobacteria bacterium]|nr:chemotaxis protein CheX [Nannocystaceae bacterium]
MSSSLVGIAGQWDGAVIVACSPATATELASIMFDVPASEVSTENLEDTLGELANMVGGNVKALLPPPCLLSLPTVVEGRDYRVRVPGATIVRDLNFGVLGGRLRVLVAERGV